MQLLTKYHRTKKIPPHMGSWQAFKLGGGISDGKSRGWSVVSCGMSGSPCGITSLYVQQF